MPLTPEQLEARGLDSDTDGDPGYAPAVATPPAAQPEDDRPALNAPPLDPKKLMTALDVASQDFGVDKGVLAGMMMRESNGNPNAVGPKTKYGRAIGLMQFLPSTAKDYGIDPRDPYQSIIGAAAYMAANLKRFGGDYQKAIAAYNWGEGNLQRQGMENMPDETRDYVAFVQDFAQRSGLSKKAAAAAAPQAPGLDYSKFPDQLPNEEAKLDRQGEKPGLISRFASALTEGTDGPPEVHIPGAAGLTPRQVMNAAGAFASGTEKLLSGANTLVSGAAGVTVDTIHNWITGDNSTAAQDSAFASSDMLDNAAEFFAPKKEDVHGVAEKVLNGLAHSAPVLGVAMATGGASAAVPATASVWEYAGSVLAHSMKSMTVPSFVEGVNRSAELLRQGASLAEAIKAGMVTTATGILTGGLPMSGGGPGIVRAAQGAIINPIFSEVGRRAENLVLAPERKRKFDIEELPVQMGTGAMFGAVGGGRARGDGSDQGGLTPGQAEFSRLTPADQMRATRGEPLRDTPEAQKAQAADDLNKATTVDDAITAATNLAIRPKEGPPDPSRPNQPSAETVESVETDDYAKRDQARLEKLREAVDEHTELLAQEREATATDPSLAEEARAATDEQLARGFPQQERPSGFVRRPPEPPAESPSSHPLDESAPEGFRRTEPPPAESLPRAESPPHPPEEPPPPPAAPGEPPAMPRTAPAGGVKTIAELYAADPHNPELHAAVRKSDLPGVLGIMARSDNVLHRRIAELMAPIVGRVSLLKSSTISWTGRMKNWDGAHARNDGPSSDVIIRARSYGDVRVMAHELGHALSSHAIWNPTERQKPIVARLQKLYDYVLPFMEGKGTFKRDGKDVPYGMMDLEEFHSEGWMNGRFAQLLHNIGMPEGKGTAWGKFTKIVAALVGVPPGTHTAWTEFMTHADALARTAKDSQSSGGPGLKDRESISGAERESPAEERPPPATRDPQVIELRKRHSVLKSILECMG